MSSKINLGIFEFDSSKLDDELAKIKSNLDVTSKALSDAKKESRDYSKDILELARAMSLLEAAGEENSDMYKEASTELKKLQKSQEEVNKATIEYEKAQKKLKKEYSDSLKLSSAIDDAAKLNIDNYETEGKSINDLRRERAKLNALRNEINLSTEEGIEMLNKYNDAIERNTLAEKESLNPQQQRVHNIGMYKEELSGLFGELNKSIDSLKRGDFLGFADGVQGGFKGMTASARAFFTTLMANPITAIVVTLGALAVATGAVIREFWKYNESIIPMMRATEQITKLQGEQADSARNLAAAYSETFGGDFEDNLKTASELANDFGVSYEEAFDMMTRATIKGADVNGEFQDSIKEYGVQFAQAGFSAQEFVDILNAGADLGVYSDKLPDAIKEAQLSITEQTKATKDALVGAFGQSFTDDLLDRVDKGQTSVKDALFEISEEAENTALTQQQLATLTADVFRGAGEDAGGAAKIFEALNYSVDESNRVFTELEQHTYDLAAANKELQEAKDEALKSDSIIAFQEDWKIAWVQIKTAWYNSINGIVEFFTNLEKQMLVFNARTRGAFLSMPNAATSAFSAIHKAFTSFIKNMMSGGSALRNLLSGNIDEAKANFSKFTGGFSTFANDLKQITTSSLNEIGSGAEAEVDRVIANIEAKTKAKVDAAKKREAEEEAKRKKAEEEANKKASPTSPTSKSSSKKVNNADKGRADAEKKLLQAIKETNQAIAERASLEAELANVELSQWIAKNASKLDSDKRLTEELAEEEKKRLDNLRERQLEALSLDTAAKEKRLSQELELLEGKKELSDTELIQKQNLLTELEILSQNHNLRELEINKDINDKIAEVDNQKATQDAEDEKLRRAIELEEELIRMEEDNATKFELQREIQSQNYEQQQNDLDEQLANQEISYDNYLGKLRLLEAENSEAIKQINEVELTDRLNQAEGMFSNVSSLLGKHTAAGKAAGIAQATINTYQGATAALKQESVLPSPFDVIAKIANVATIIASGLKSVQSIKSVKTPKAQRGMITKGASHANGGIPAIVGGNTPIELEGGEAIINKTSTAMFSPLLSRINEIGGGIKFANGGLAPSDMTSVQNSISSTFDAQFTESISLAVARGASEGTYLGSQTGIKDLNTNNRIANEANH